MTTRQKVLTIAVVGLLIAGNIFASLIGQTAPPFYAQQWLNTTNQPITIEQYQNSVLILEFWATWCPHCQASIPEMKNLYNKYKSKGVGVVTLTDESNTDGSIANFVQQNGINYIVGTGTSSRPAYGIVAVPTAFVIDKGIITWEGSPETDPDGLEQAVIDALASGGIDIITPDTTVANDVTQYTINGTNDSIVGTMTWQNQLTGSSGSFPATNSWTLNVNLGVGGNLITVTGTNIYGDEGRDSVVIYRAILPYTDDIHNIGLLHFDAIVTNTWADGSPDCFIAVDDNSSGRTACAPIMNTSNDYWHIARDDSTMPSFQTNSPYSGNYLHFDGGDAIIVTNNAWLTTDNMYLDLSFKLDGLPNASDNYMGVFVVEPVKVYVQNIGGSGRILTIVYKTATDGQFMSSSKTLTLGNWYHLSLLITNNTEKLIVGNDSEGFQTTTMSLTGMMDVNMDYVVIGNSFWVPSRTFQGDMDEIRWGTVIPEPFSFGIIGLLSLLLFRRK